MSLSQDPVVRVTMMIRRPPEEVFEAFVDPGITTRFWFTRGSGRLTPGATVTWHWDMYGASAEVTVNAVEPVRRIAIGWPTPVEWRFEPRDAGTFVTVTASGFTGSDDEKVAQALDSTGGFSFLLAAAKAWLEHGVPLNLVADHHPDAHVK